MVGAFAQCAQVIGWPWCSGGSAAGVYAGSSWTVHSRRPRVSGSGSGSVSATPAGTRIGGWGPGSPRSDRRQAGQSWVSSTGPSHGRTPGARSGSHSRDMVNTGSAGATESLTAMCSSGRQGCARSIGQPIAARGRLWSLRCRRSSDTHEEGNQCGRVGLWVVQSPADWAHVVACPVRFPNAACRTRLENRRCWKRRCVFRVMSRASAVGGGRSAAIAAPAPRQPRRGCVDACPPQREATPPVAHAFPPPAVRAWLLHSPVVRGVELEVAAGAAYEG